MSETDPIFSIIIPTYNRPEMLSSCLGSLTKLDYSSDRFEVIVVDDGSVVPLGQVTESFKNETRVVLLSRENGGPAVARNTGIAAARGKYFAFTDDDCMPDRGWLKELEICLERDSCVMVGGRTMNALISNPYTVASQLIVGLVYEHYNSNPSAARFFASNNIAVPAEAFRAIGGFDPVFRTSEDRDACDRWLACGYRMVYAEKAIIYHAHDLSFKQFWRQHVNYGRGALRFNRAHALRSHNDSTFKADFYMKLPGRLIKALSRIPAKQVPILLFLMMTWFVANTFGFMLETVWYLAGRSKIT